MANMRKAWRWAANSETTLGLLLLIVALAGAGVLVDGKHACGSARCHGERLIVTISVCGTLILCAVSVLGVAWSSAPGTRRWALIGLAGELACLGAGALA
jgi:hypothetical protein